MNTIIANLKDIFSFSDSDREKVGLSQFKNSEAKPVIQPKQSNHSEMKLSDLMRKSY